MLIPLQRLRRSAATRSRAVDLARIRKRLGAARRSSSPAEVELARRIRSLRLELAETIGSVSSCASCATGLAAPEGTYAGGHCCSVPEDNVFTEDEVLALAAGGTRARHLQPPPDERAGCLFRGERGCSLAIEDRPSICLVYACRALQRELAAAGKLDRFEAVVANLTELMHELREVASTRRADRGFRELQRGIERAARSALAD